MRCQIIEACVMTIAFIGSAGHAMAQTPNQTSANPTSANPTSPNQTSAIEATRAKLTLSQEQKRTVEQALRNEAPQSSAAGAEAEVGATLPTSLSALPMPNSLIRQVPESKDYKFVKLANRVLIVDPVERTITEIIPLPTTAGANAH